MSVLGRNWRFLAISAGSASLVRGKTDWIRKPLFYPLNYGNNDICDFRFAIADCKRPRRAGVDALVVSFGEAPCEVIMPEGDFHALTVARG